MKSLTLSLLIATTVAGAAEAPVRLERVTVTADRDVRRIADTPQAISSVDETEIDLVGATHPNEIFARMPGTWVSRGSGQEHLTAIRSPVLTGAGACGAFLFLEDGIAVRPAGFCNVNQLFEINTEMADGLEVVRGPGSVLYGSNAMHGVINVLHSPLRLPLNEAALMVGEFGHRRLAIDHSDLTLYGSRRFKYFGETSGSFQGDSGFDQHKLNLGWHGPIWRAQVAASSLDQDTAGFVVGEDAYRDPQLRRSNPNPEAYRKADSFRAWGVAERALLGDREITFRPFLRYSEMEFLQHFLPGQPLEENGQVSAGLVSDLRINRRRSDWRIGLDLEWAQGWLRETQAEPISEGSDFLRETRPAGKHYDYTVAQYAISPWFNAEYRYSRATTLSAGMRGDWIHYRHDNRMSTGNLREDGSECGFGGCLFNRPADRDDTFAFLSPKLGLLHRLNPRNAFYANLLRGFRVPQATELYRLQRGQNVADLDPETLDSIETGWRGHRGAFEFDLALFAMQKRNVIFRDAEGFNVSDGRTRHYGVEFELDWKLSAQWRAGLTGTVARHQYAFDYLPESGEQFVSGRDVDTAPRTLGSARIQWRPRHSTRLEAEYQHLGSYWLDAENTQRYSGHGLVHLRAAQELQDWTLRLRLNNLLDEDYAERADFAFGQHRYFPGWPRRLSVEAAYRFQ